MNVILSIKPKYVEKILSGEKRYEFRKRIFKKDVDRVFIYATSPIKKIVASFVPGEIVEDTPEDMWNRFGDISGTSKEDFFDYFKGKEKGFVIEIKELETFKEPLDPYSTIEGFRAPISFQYCELDQLPTSLSV